MIEFEVYTCRPYAYRPHTKVTALLLRSQQQLHMPSCDLPSNMLSCQILLPSTDKVHELAGTKCRLQGCQVMAKAVWLDPG